jgi:hypothetical protein
MKVEQFPYLSAEAVRLRARDCIPPWGVHPCEVDSFDPDTLSNGPFRDAWREASRLRREIEANE